MVQKHVLAPDRGKHIAIMILHPFRHPGVEAWPEQIWAFVKHQLFEVRHAQHPVKLDNLVIGYMQFAFDHLEQPRRRAR